MSGQEPATAPDTAQELVENGRRHRAAERLDDALDAFDRAARLDPRSIDAWVGLVGIHGALRRYRPAIEAARRALALDPENHEARFGFATNLTYVDGYEEAEPVAEAMVAARPDDIAALVTAGKIALARRRREDALGYFAEAKRLGQGMKPVYLTIAQILSEFGQPEDGREALDELLAAWPDDDAIVFAVAQRRMLACDWRGFDDMTRRLGTRLDAVVAAGRVDPDMLWTLANHGFGYADTMKVARGLGQRAARRVPAEARSALPARTSGGRIRVGFIQAMTTFHSTQVAIRNIVGRVDRRAFQVLGYARHDRIGPGDFQTEFRRAFDRFADLTALSDAQAAAAIAADGVDVLIDMQGLNALNNLGVLAYRPARVIALYYGFSHGTGGMVHDYFLTDRGYLPASLATHSGDKIVYLPGCHMAPTLGDIAPGTPGRADHGLPETGFVFCNFNNPWKFDPVAFAFWMRLLRHVPGSVLWLLEWRRDAVANLRRAAADAGVDPDRLVFAKLAPHAEHLKRSALADLGLNGVAVGGGVTTFDTLWAGVPVVALEGAADMLWSRLGGVMLRAAGLGELAFDTFEAMERGVIELTQDPARLAAARRKLFEARHRCDLFDIGKAARKIEFACRAMLDIHERGEAPRDIHLDRDFA